MLHSAPPELPKGQHSAHWYMICCLSLLHCVALSWYTVPPPFSCTEQHSAHWSMMCCLSLLNCVALSCYTVFTLISHTDTHSAHWCKLCCQVQFKKLQHVLYIAVDNCDSCLWIVVLPNNLSASENYVSQYQEILSISTWFFSYSLEIELFSACQVNKTTK